MTEQQQFTPAATAPVGIFAGPGGAARRGPALGLVLTSMTSVQLGAALSLSLVGRLGVAGTTWLRLFWGALIMLAIARPRLRSAARVPGQRGAGRRLLAPALLGVVNAVMTLAFFAAITRLPLGTTVAIEFLGPLGVAAARSRSPRGLLPAGLALIGVLVLTTPWADSPDDLIGLALAAVAACGWAAYILLTARVAQSWPALSGLALAMPVAALVSAPVGLIQVWGRLTPAALAATLGLALLLPVLPYTAELLALRRLPPRVFGVWMSLEPAIGTGIGLGLLRQVPRPGQLIGVLLVVLASVAAARTEP